MCPLAPGRGDARKLAGNSCGAFCLGRAARNCACTLARLQLQSADPERPQGAASFPLRAGLLSLQPAAKAGARRVPGRWRQYRERRSLSRRLTPYTCVRRRFQVRVLGGSGRLALRNGGLQRFVSFKRSPRVLRRRRKPTAVAPKGYASGRVAVWPRGVTVALGTLNRGSNPREAMFSCCSAA